MNLGTKYPYFYPEYIPCDLSESGVYTETQPDSLNIVDKL